MDNCKRDSFSVQRRELAPKTVQLFLYLINEMFYVKKKKSSDFGVPAIIPEKRRKSKPPKVHKRAFKKSPLKMSPSPSPIGNVDVLIGQTKGWELSADWSFGHIEAVPKNGKSGRLLDENQEEIVIGKLDLNAIKDPAEGQ